LSRGDENKRRDTSFGPSASAHEFRQGLARHQQGQLAEAERHYEAALKSQPDNFEALHMLGVIALQKGRFEQGVEIIRKVVALNEFRRLLSTIWPRVLKTSVDSTRRLSILNARSRSRQTLPTRSSIMGPFSIL
jgi:predicted Zn-dependent protease